MHIYEMIFLQNFFKKLPYLFKKRFQKNVTSLRVARRRYYCFNTNNFNNDILIQVKIIFYHIYF